MKVIRIFMAVLAVLAFTTVQVHAGMVIEEPVPIIIGGSVTEVKELFVDVRNVSDNKTANAFNFTIGGAPDWVVANQYILVDFKANYPEYGIHLLTKNKKYVANVLKAQKPFYPKVLEGGNPDGEPGKAGVDDDNNGTIDDKSELGWPGSDDIVSYGGLIDPNSCDNVSARADLAWRAELKWLGADLKPVIKKDNKAGGTEKDEVVDSSATNWNSDWKYVGDEANTLYDVKFVRNETSPGVYAYNYLISVIGYADGVAHTNPAISALAGAYTLLNSDPAKPNKDVALYIGATLGALPAGTYTTQMYVQLIKEE